MGLKDYKLKEICEVGSEKSTYRYEARFCHQENGDNRDYYWSMPIDEKEKELLKIDDDITILILVATSFNFATDLREICNKECETCEARFTCYTEDE